MDDNNHPVANEGLCDPASFRRIPPGNHLDPVHRHKDGAWWFCDETWSECLGPYATQDEANTKLSEYCKQL